MGSVAVQYWAVSSGNLTWVVHNDNLSFEVISWLGWVVLGFTSNVTSSQFLGGYTFYVESNIVSWDSFSELFMVHFDWFTIGINFDWRESDCCSWLKDTGFNSTDWHSSDTWDFVNILQWQSEWFVSWSLWWFNWVQDLEEGWSFPPRKVGGFFDHVVSVPSWNWAEGNIIWFESNLLKIVLGFSFDFFESLFTPGNGLFVHLVATDDQLSDT